MNSELKANLAKKQYLVELYFLGSYDNDGI